MFELVAAQVDNAWLYVAVGYTVVLGGMAGFVVMLGLRIRRARRTLESRQ